MNKNGAVQMKDHSFPGNHPLLFMAILHNFEAAYYAGSNHESACTWISKHYLAYPVKAVSKARVALLTENAKLKEGGFASIPVIVSYLLRWFAIDYNSATVDADIQAIKQSSLTTNDYKEQLCTESLRCGFGYNKKIIKRLFSECVDR